MKTTDSNKVGLRSSTYLQDKSQIEKVFDKQLFDKINQFDHI